MAFDCLDWHQIEVMASNDLGLGLLPQRPWMALIGLKLRKWLIEIATSTCLNLRMHPQMTLDWDRFFEWPQMASNWGRGLEWPRIEITILNGHNLRSRPRMTSDWDYFLEWPELASKSIKLRSWPRMISDRDHFLEWPRMTSNWCRGLKQFWIEITASNGLKRCGLLMATELQGRIRDE